MLSCFLLAGAIYLQGPNYVARLDQISVAHIDHGSLNLYGGYAETARFPLTPEQEAMPVSDLLTQVVAPCEAAGNG
jgi:hypothetical protein